MRKKVEANIYKCQVLLRSIAESPNEKQQPSPKLQAKIQRTEMDGHDEQMSTFHKTMKQGERSQVLTSPSQMLHSLDPKVDKEWGKLMSSKLRTVNLPGLNRSGHNS